MLAVIEAFVFVHYNGIILDTSFSWSYLVSLKFHKSVLCFKVTIFIQYVHCTLFLNMVDVMAALPHRNLPFNRYLESVFHLSLA